MATCSFVSNVTDIEDKIIARAAEEGTSTTQVAARYEALWWETMAALNVGGPMPIPMPPPTSSKWSIWWPT